MFIRGRVWAAVAGVQSAHHSPTQPPVRAPPQLFVVCCRCRRCDDLELDIAQHQRFVPHHTTPHRTTPYPACTPNHLPNSEGEFLLLSCRDRCATVDPSDLFVCVLLPACRRLVQDAVGPLRRHVRTVCMFVGRDGCVRVQQRLIVLWNHVMCCSVLAFSSAGSCLAIDVRSIASSRIVSVRALHGAFGGPACRRKGVTTPQHTMTRT